ncbi:60S ACIDIC ribosomal protein P0 [Anaeramoeba flamelloides]|uniref:60S ACIDIC ribosomal protein P0 n=1 Tax=Anaeramoeba flamelloides TaxID=1746091 RepID=A0AAV7YB31_9EUKA|nr:60S ACIDIC ribosomal protein P0 [Anaeramoeba flamelloides]
MGAEKKGSKHKKVYIDKVLKLLDTYQKVLIVSSNNISSKQIQIIRKALLKKAVVLMGKNSLIRRACKMYAEKNPKVNELIPLIKQNIGLVFTNEDPRTIRDIIVENKINAPAKAGTVAPNDVIVPKGDTGLEPTQTTFLQALDIQTRIAKRQIEILYDVKLVSEGEKVGSSEATLLSKLGIKPFVYGMKLVQVYDNGSVYGPQVLDITDEMLKKNVLEELGNVSGISLELGFPTQVSLPYSFMNNFRNILAISLETGYEIKEAESIRELLENPEALKELMEKQNEEEKDEKEEEKEEEPEPESESESDDDILDNKTRNKRSKPTFCELPSVQKVHFLSALTTDSKATLVFTKKSQISLTEKVLPKKQIPNKNNNNEQHSKKALFRKSVLQN